MRAWVFSKLQSRAKAWRSSSRILSSLTSWTRLTSPPQRMFASSPMMMPSCSLAKPCSWKSRTAILRASLPPRPGRRRVRSFTGWKSAAILRTSCLASCRRKALFITRRSVRRR